ncbi:two-component system, NtrC family, sensor histidine kinase HydH [Methylacidimicrobium cyclopophantes]|uniref:histidine kinase n=1 Tax=Methylacidimicrobium cyclopophantes TaxID=1041766 RepID=A0A5E6MBB2_9BACT|nr:HAMP domain-containing sensor histidine kinase [Methylacidimicrobium cyclopophantes]VVM05584.1 two-component system, NtrC family, sensor histidine kinase HydH [Methylacidimicrobium cyclopophantes]
MFRSMRGRLVLLLLLLVAATASAGALMVALFRQSASARAAQAQAESGRACDAIAEGYAVFAAKLPMAPLESSEASARLRLAEVIRQALRDRPAIEGGIWREGKGSLAYAYPTYPGERPKTDVPEAELPRIEAVNHASLEADRQVVQRYATPSQTLLLTASPLPGPIPGLTAWTMTRVLPFAGRSYRLLTAGLSILFATVLAAAVLLSHFTLSWSRHVRRIESALQAHDITDLPTLAATGERELDRIVSALNDAGSRLSEARKRADHLSRQVAAAERLAAIGRVSAGIAHEIRNPIAAMQLKAENALSGDGPSKDGALRMILGQIDRLDALLRRLLSVTEREKLRCEAVRLEPFLSSCVATLTDLAKAKNLTLVHRADAQGGCFDPEQVRRAVDNLLRNAIEAAPEGTEVSIRARKTLEGLVFLVHDSGNGPPAHVREHLFEPFVTGRPGGTGLGLSIVREIASAHGGSVRLLEPERGAGTTFEMVLPWPRS